MKEQRQQMLQYADWIKGETPNKPTRETRFKQEHIKNVVMNYEEIKAGPGGHLDFLNCIALKINLQIDSHDIEAAPEAATATAVNNNESDNEIDLKA